MMWLWLVTAASPIVPDVTSGQLTIDLRVILQTFIAGLLVWLLTMLRDSRMKMAASVTAIAVMETKLEGMEKTLKRIEDHGK
jgi:predicted Zn-dependent protease